MRDQCIAPTTENADDVQKGTRLGPITNNQLQAGKAAKHVVVRADNRLLARFERFQPLELLEPDRGVDVAQVVTVAGRDDAVEPGLLLVSAAPGGGGGGGP